MLAVSIILQCMDIRSEGNHVQSKGVYDKASSSGDQYQNLSVLKAVQLVCVRIYHACGE